jgi:basic secretory peptidase family protein
MSDTRTFLSAALALLALSGCGDDSGGNTDPDGGAAGGDAATPDGGPSGTPDAAVDTAFDEVCTPGVTLVLEDTDEYRIGLFTDAMTDDPTATVQEIGRNVCQILYRAASEVRNATHLELIIRYAPGEVAWKSGDGADITVMISTDHMKNVYEQGRDLAKEIKGILFHEMTHMYQQDDSDRDGVDLGLIEGIADYVRILAGYTPEGAGPNPGGSWHDGYTTTAFFLIWLDEEYPDFVYRLNLSMDNTDGIDWSEESFRDLTGKSADELWEDYADSF